MITSMNSSAEWHPGDDTWPHDRTDREGGKEENTHKPTLQSVIWNLLHIFPTEKKKKSLKW